jgi:hypothetical protein
MLNLAALAYLWSCAIARRRGVLLIGSLALLSAEGGALVWGRGNCPFGQVQRRLGDSVPLFELILPPHLARAAIPGLAAVTVAGIVTLVARPPRTGTN